VTASLNTIAQENRGATSLGRGDVMDLINTCRRKEMRGEASATTRCEGKERRMETA
jgi:hypothetical protein